MNMEPTKEQLQEEIMEILYQKSLQKPLWVTCSEVYWNIKNIKVSERSVREALDWLVKNDVVICQAEKYQISKREFIEMSERKKTETDHPVSRQPETKYANTSQQAEHAPSLRTSHSRNNLFFVIIALIAFLLSGILIGILLFNHYAKDENIHSVPQLQITQEADSITLSSLHVRGMGYIQEEYTLNQNFKNLSRSLNEQQGINQEILAQLRVQQEQINSLMKYNEQQACAIEQYQRQIHIYLWILGAAALVTSSLLIAWYGRRN